MCGRSHRQKIKLSQIITLAFNFVLLYLLIFVLCPNVASFAMENNAPTNEDMASYEGKYPKDLFNKTVVVNGQSIGHVAKETDNIVVVFGDSDNSRFDIPKSKVTVEGGSVVVNEPLDQYAIDRNAPLPEGKSLRPSAEEIRQVAGEAPEQETYPLPENRSPSAIEEKAREVASEVKSSVGYEITQASRAVKEKLKDAGEAVISSADVGTAAKTAASGVKESLREGLTITKEKLSVAQNMSEAQLSAESALKIEKEARQRTTEVDLGSYEGKYPNDLFRRAVVTANDQHVGYVAKDTGDTIVIFNDNDSSIRFDIPKSEIVLEGSSVVVNEDLLFRYRMHKDDPMPPDRQLRESAEEIRSTAAEPVQLEQKEPTTTPDRVIEEGHYLASTPRPQTTTVSRPEGYIDTESEIVKRIKNTVAELREVIIAGTKVAKKKARQAQEAAVEKQAEMDAETISRMGNLAMKFADSLEDVLSEIQTRTFAEQEQIYTGFLKLMDQQRDLVLARRDLAARLKDSVSVPVVESSDMQKLKAPPELPEAIDENSRAATSTKRKSTPRKKKQVAA